MNMLCITRLTRRVIIMHLFCIAIGKRIMDASSDSATVELIKVGFYFLSQYNRASARATDVSGERAATEGECCKAGFFIFYYFILQSHKVNVFHSRWVNMCST